MAIGNMDIISVMLAAAIAGIGSGIGVAIGQALYKALMEDKINKFLDKKHREEALKKLTGMDPARKILYGDNPPIETPASGYSIPPGVYQPPKIPQRSPESVLNKMLGK